MPGNLENSAVATELEKVSFHSNPKERQWQRLEISSRKSDTKGTFHAKMGTIKNRNVTDLKEAEDNKKRSEEAHV